MGDTFIGDWGAWNNKVKIFFNGRNGWAKAVFDAAKDEEKFQEVKINSPFADKVVIGVSYRIGTKLYGDIHAFADANGGVDIASSIVKNAIRSNGWTVHDSDDYLLAFSQLKSRGACDMEIFWIGSEKPGVKGPESTKRWR